MRHDDVDLNVSSKVDMEIDLVIREAFPVIDNSITDEYIENNQDLMWLPDKPNLLSIVPAYMLWCIKYKDQALVDMHTVNALSEYGRCKNKDNEHLNFKFTCNTHQVSAVYQFLKWCSDNALTADDAQIQRALRNWQK